MNCSFLLLATFLLAACNVEPDKMAAENTGGISGAALPQNSSADTSATRYQCYGSQEKAIARRLLEQPDVKGYLREKSMETSLLRDGVCMQVEHNGSVQKSDLPVSEELIPIHPAVAQEAKRRGLSDLQLMAAVVDEHQQRKI